MLEAPNQDVVRPSPPRRRGRPPRGDGAEYLPPNRLKFWIFTCLEEAAQAGTPDAGPHDIATWYEERVLRTQLDAAGFNRLRDTISEKLRQLATRHYRVYVRRRQVLLQYPGEPMAYARYVYRLSAYGRRILKKMRDRELPGAPYYIERATR